MSNKYDKKFNNEGNVILFHKSKADASTNRPDLSGKIIAHRDIKQGEQINIAVWTAKDEAGNPKRSAKGDCYLSGKISDSMEGVPNHPCPEKRPVREDFIGISIHGDDDIPF